MLDFFVERRHSRDPDRPPDRECTRRRTIFGNSRGHPAWPVARSDQFNSATADLLFSRSFRGGPEIGNRTQQMRQTKPTAIWRKFADSRGDFRGSGSFIGKRANEANANLDRVCGLHGTGGLWHVDRLHRTHANRANEVIVKMNRICRLTRSPVDLEDTTSTHSPFGVRLPGSLSRRAAFYRISKHDGRRDEPRAARRSNAAGPGGESPGARRSSEGPGERAGAMALPGGRSA